MGRELMGRFVSSFSLSEEMEVRLFADRDYLILKEIFGSHIHLRKEEALLLSNVIQATWRPQVSPIANPYATHDIMWDTGGSGLCMKEVARPNGNTATCNEPVESSIHGGPMPRLIGDTQ